MTPCRAYLAGPDVFLPNAAEVARAKLAACAQVGVEGLFPLDIEAEASVDGEFADGVAIAEANMALMRSADVILANCTPFRGIHADAGTAFEMGFFAGMGKPVFAYSSSAGDAAQRTRAALRLGEGESTDPAGMAIEDFGHPDNLMLSGSVAASKGCWSIVADGDPAAMAAFERALGALAERARAMLSDSVAKLTLSAVAIIGLSLIHAAPLAAQAIPATAEVDWITAAPDATAGEVTLSEGTDTPFAVIFPTALFASEGITATASDSSVIPAGAVLAEGRVSWGKMRGNRIFCEIERQKGHEFNQCLMIAQGAPAPSHVFRSYNPGGAYFFGLNRPNPIPLSAPVMLKPVPVGDGQKLRLVLRLERVKSRGSVFQFNLCYADYTYSFLLNARNSQLACIGPRFELDQTHRVSEFLGGRIEMLHASEKSIDLRLHFPPAGQPFALHGVGF